MKGKIRILGKVKPKTLFSKWELDKEIIVGQLYRAVAITDKGITGIDFIPVGVGEEGIEEDYEEGLYARDILKLKEGTLEND